MDTLALIQPQPDAHYADPILAQIYDYDSPWSEDRDYYRALPVGRTENILDLGCGTGLVSAALAADGHRVTGVDPAQAMLEVAAARPGGADVRWVCGTSAAIPKDAPFDLASSDDIIIHARPAL